MSENEQTPKETVQVEQQQHAPDVVAVLQNMHQTMREQVRLLSEVNNHLQWQRQFHHQPMLMGGMPQRPMFTHQSLGARGDFESQMKFHAIARTLSIMDSSASECDLILDAFIEVLRHAGLLALNATVVSPLDRSRAVLQRRLSALTSGSVRFAPGSYDIDQPIGPYK